MANKSYKNGIVPYYNILMGDIIGSSKYDARLLSQSFVKLISSCNEKFERKILSPYTITLGDEFQGNAHSLSALLESLIFIEETAIKRKLNFKIRYVAVQGEIDTPINRLKAYGMMGDGLTKARMMLTDKRRGILSAVESKPATRGRFKTSHFQWI